MTFRLPSLAECTVLLLIGTLVIASFVVSRQQAQVKELAVARTLENAQLLSQFARKAHQQYADSIRSAVASGVRPTTESTPPLGMVHFPATFSRHMTRRYAQEDGAAEFRIYSADPFETTASRRLDNFANAALSALTGGNDEYWRLDQGEREQVVRYAAPIRMRESCVDCHNRPAWNLNKQDWAVGDVRGVSEVSLIVQPALVFLPSERALLMGLITVAALLGLLVVYPVVRREVSRRTHFEQLSGDLTVLAETDVLTGLANRRAFDDALHKATSVKRTNGPGAGLIMADIDHFKAVNDTYGHDVGDRIIARVGAVIRENVRPGDFTARIGGEEFAALCDRVEPEGLGALAERMRRAIEVEVFEIGDIRLQVTASIGAAILSEEDDNRSFFRHADQLLYRAKQTGRNVVCMSTGAGETSPA